MMLGGIVPSDLRGNRRLITIKNGDFYADEVCRMEVSDTVLTIVFVSYQVNGSPERLKIEFKSNADLELVRAHIRDKMKGDDSDIGVVQ